MRIVSKICANPLLIFTRQGSLFLQEFFGTTVRLRNQDAWDEWSDGEASHEARVQLLQPVRNT
jgi:hypothetical protein